MHTLNEWRKILPKMVNITKSAYFGYNVYVVYQAGSKLINGLQVALNSPGILAQVAPVGNVFKFCAVLGTAYSVYSVIQEWRTKTPTRL